MLPRAKSLHSSQQVNTLLCIAQHNHGIGGAEDQQESRVMQNADEMQGCEEAHQVLQMFSSISHIPDSILTLPLSLLSKDFCIYFMLTQLFTGSGGGIS